MAKVYAGPPLSGVPMYAKVTHEDASMMSLDDARDGLDYFSEARVSIEPQKTSLLAKSWVVDGISKQKNLRFHRADAMHIAYWDWQHGMGESDPHSEVPQEIYAWGWGINAAARRGLQKAEVDLHALAREDAFTAFDEARRIAGDRPRPPCRPLAIKTCAKVLADVERVVAEWAESKTKLPRIEG